MNDDSLGRFKDFHAGRFLREALEGSGHDISWLAAQTGKDTDEIERLFVMPNMDVMLFVSIGNAFGQPFYDRMHEEIFGR